MNGGLLDVEGSIASSILTTVNAGGTLSGTGTVGNTTVAQRRHLRCPAMARRARSMTVTGNLAFQSGAIYLVSSTPTTSTFAHVTGTATLGGHRQRGIRPRQLRSKQYTILTATGGVSGTFSSGVNTHLLPASFTTSLSYDANHAYLNLALDFTAIDRASTSTSRTSATR